jgi:tetratricopeptide (TPR) repeat protein
LYNIGVLLLDEQKPDEAIPHFAEAAHIQPGYADAYVGLGLAQSQTGQIPEAIKNLQHALDLQPDFPGVAKRLAELREQSTSPKPK